MTLLLAMAFVSCSQDTDFEQQAETEKGQLVFTLDAKTDFVVNSRAVNEASYKNVDDYTVVVTDKNGVEQLNCKGADVAANMPLTMPIGSYSVKAYYGTQHAASRDAFYVEGNVYGTIKADQQEAVTVTCTPTCGKVIVEFSEDMATYFSEYQVNFTGTKALDGGSFNWFSTDVAPWYVQLDAAGETLGFTIAVKTHDDYVNSENKEQVNEKTGTFKLERNKAYRMKVSPNYTPTENGSVSIEVTIDESTNDKEVDIEIPVDWL